MLNLLWWKKSKEAELPEEELRRELEAEDDEDDEVDATIAYLFDKVGTFEAALIEMHRAREADNDRHVRVVAALLSMLGGEARLSDDVVEAVRKNDRLAYAVEEEGGVVVVRLTEKEVAE